MVEATPPTTEGELRTIKIKQLSGQDINVQVNKDILVSDLKRLLEEKSGIPAGQQRLIYKAKAFADDQKLSEYVKKDGEAVHLVKNLQQSSTSQGTQSSGPQPAPQSQPQQPQPQQMPQGNPFMMFGAHGHMPSGQNDPFTNMLNQLLPGPNGQLPQTDPMQLLQQMGINLSFPPQTQFMNQQQMPPTQSSGDSEQQPNASAGQQRPQPATQSTGSTSRSEQQTSQGQTGQQTFATTQAQPTASQSQPRVSPRVNNTSAPQQPAQPSMQGAGGGQQVRANQEEVPQPQPQVTQSSGRAAEEAKANVIQLPHQNLFELNRICNRMMGNNTSFPGPPMPQLPFDRNPIHLLGSYMSNMAFNLQRLLPFMQRCGDLMQRESLQTNADHRGKTAELAIVLGMALEEVAKATASTAHLYKNLELGPQPGQCHLETQSYDDMFEPIIRHTRTVNVRQPQAQAQPEPRAQSPETQSQQQRVPVPTPSVQQQQRQESSSQPAEKPFMAKMGEEFKEMEILMMMQGAFTSVQNFAKRLQGVIRSEVPDRGQTREGRKAFVDRVLKVLKDIIYLPDGTKGAIYEEFDPVLIINETLEDKLPHLFDQFLDFEGTDAAFVEMAKKETTEIIGNFISEIEDGFIDGINDIIPFIRDNMKALIKASSEPKNAAMAELMAVPPIMSYIERANNDYKGKKEAQMTQPVQQPKQEVREVQMEEEKKEPQPVTNKQPLSKQLAAAKSPEERRKILMNRYQETLKADQAIIATRVQRPLSRAYQSLDLNAANELIDDEQQKATKDYERTKSEKAKTKPEFFKAKVRESLIDTQRFKSAVVDEEVKKVNAEVDIPAELQKAYYDMLRAGIKARLCSDKDYQKLKSTHRFDHLDQL